MTDYGEGQSAGERRKAVPIKLSSPPMRGLDSDKRLDGTELLLGCSNWAKVSFLNLALDNCGRPLKGRPD